MLEALEGRIVLSAAASNLQVPTSTVLAVSQTTIEKSQELTLVATVDNASHPVPVTTGKVKFVVQSPTDSRWAQSSLTSLAKRASRLQSSTRSASIK